MTLSMAQRQQQCDEVIAMLQKAQENLLATFARQDEDRARRSREQACTPPDAPLFTGSQTSDSTAR